MKISEFLYFKVTTMKNNYKKIRSDSWPKSTLKI